MTILARIVGKVGLAGDYKSVFWKFAVGRLIRGDLEGLIAVALVSHHLIMFSRAASGGQQNASNYSTRLREAVAAE
jgi:hypothetical protein